VSDAPDPGISGAGIVRVGCVDAARDGMVDTFCVVTCSDRCVGYDALVWESFGEWRRRSSVLIHQRCGGPRNGLSFDCASARREISE
jgi:hypothetical protein